jgi:hypothetical protein
MLTKMTGPSSAAQPCGGVRFEFDARYRGESAQRRRGFGDEIVTVIRRVNAIAVLATRVATGVSS